MNSMGFRVNVPRTRLPEPRCRAEGHTAGVTGGFGGAAGHRGLPARLLHPGSARASAPLPAPGAGREAPPCRQAGEDLSGSRCWGPPPQPRPVLTWPSWAGAGRTAGRTAGRAGSAVCACHLATPQRPASLSLPRASPTHLHIPCPEPPPPPPGLLSWATFSWSPPAPDNVPWAFSFPPSPEKLLPRAPSPSLPP